MTTATVPAAPVASRSGSMLLAAEVALAALTCSAAFGLIRLFADSSFVPEVLVSALAAHALAATCRHRGLTVGATLAIAAVAMVAGTSWLVLPETTAYGIPTGETMRVARENLSEAWLLFGDVKAPAPTLPGFVLAASIGVWFLALLADTAAFRAGGMVEAMVPAATLFVFGAALGAPRHRVAVTAIFVASLLAFWLASRAHHQLSSPSWMARDEGRGLQAIMRTGLVIGTVGVLAAMFVGPRLPGADADAVIPWRASDRGGGGSRVTVSPLVDIRTRIVDQASVEVFKVESPIRSYWRLTALETFDGRIWSSSRKYRKATGTLDPAVPVDQLPSDAVEQHFVVGQLDSIWLPAAFRPVGIDGVPARYDGESASLLTEADSAIGADYVVQSAVPRVDAAALTAAPAAVPEPIAATYLTLPAGFPAAVAELARNTVAGSTTPYDAARRLQDFFRGGEFTYDLGVQPGHGGDALQHFLFETRRGYCEQFAGAYAAMARAVGIPARIGVGFTTGELGGDGRYTVRGYHGHAWPEVYLAGFGWIAFEPTPGRGIPGGESYTGVAEAQATPGEPNTATTLPTTTTTVAAGGGAGAPTTLPRFDPDNPGAGGTDIEAASPWPKRLLVLLAVVLAVPIVWVATVLSISHLRRWRRRAAARTAADRVDLVWTEIGEALARTGMGPRRSETPAEYAARASRLPHVDAEAITAVADLATETRYAPAGTVTIGDADLATAMATAREVERSVARHLDRRTRVRAAFDPRVPAGR